MAAGFQVTKDALNQRAGSTVVAGEAWFDDVRRMKVWLDTQTNANLVTLGFTDAEAAALKASFTDLDNLRKVAYGQGTQATANNFFFWGSQLRGVL